MKNEDNLPDCQGSNYLSENNAGTQLVCDLHVRGNEVYLPQTPPVDFKSEEYEKEFLSPLPDDIAPEVGSVLRSKRSHFTVLRIVFIVLFLFFIFGAIYHYFPRQRIVSTSDELFEDGLKVSAEYKKNLTLASEKYESKQWESVIKLLEKDAKAICEDQKQTLDNEKLLRYYFNALNNSADYPGDTPFMIIEKVRMHSPNRLGWYIDWLRIKFPECNSVRAVEPEPAHIEEIKKLLQKENPSDYYTVKWIKASDYNIYKKLLDLYWARLNFIYWCYLNPRKNMDKEDPGVFEREVAYQICKKYTEADSVDRDFLQLQIDIIKEVISADMGWGSFEGAAYFDGELYYRQGALEGILHQCEDKLKNINRQQGDLQ